MKKLFEDYYVGFDIGTNSVGWAVTDTEYNILKVNGKAMWGVHLFEEGKTAIERRTFRSARRRLARRAERLSLLRDFFRDEINKVDSDFLKRLSESKFIESDRSLPQKNTLFNDTAFTDKVYHNLFPTIYHLRSALVHKNDKFDIRLIYLAIHHILKHRGHFLFEGQGFTAATSFDDIFVAFLNQLADYDIEFSANIDIKPILVDRSLTKTDKQKELKKLLGADTSPKKAIIGLITGGTVKLADLFDDETLKDAEIEKISFSDNYEDKEEAISRVLDESRMSFIDSIKALYDWAILSSIRKDHKYLADAKKAIYDEHEKDLATLKKMVKQYCSESQYAEIFKAKDINTNYCAYVNNKKEKSCSQIDFHKCLKKHLDKIKPVEQDFIALKEKIELGTALPKQVSKENGVIPYQLHLEELKQILANTEKHYSFLQKKDEAGLSVSDKIKSMMTFRIPYYVGPLNNHSKFAWIERLEGKKEKIYPWNFDNIVDKTASAENFITRMTNFCTYIPTEKVLAKDSICYSSYNIYNQLNILKIDGERISQELKTALFEDLFLNVDKPQKVTANKIKKYLKNIGKFTTEAEIDLTGIDVEIPASMKSYLDFKRILQKNTLADHEIQIIDTIIEKIVILGESKDLLQNFLEKNYSSSFRPEQIAEIVKLNYSGWGRFSAKFLTQIYHTDKVTDEFLSILGMLKSTNKNLMELLSSDYSFKKNIDEYNVDNSKKINGITPAILDDLYVSPAVKRSIWRTLLLCKEIVHIAGHEPKKIFIEVARDIDTINKGKKTQSRKSQLQELYKACSKDEPQLCNMLQGETDSRLQGKQLYLYYTQMGRCMYSGEPIEISDLYNRNIYDVDHIYPQSKVKDDSIINNKVLVKKTINNEKKGNTYPIPSECVSSKARELWQTLLARNLISKEKYNRLTRKEGFSEIELSGFIARQLVETRQSSKAVAETLTKIYPGPTTSIVYVKAGNVSLFRDQYEIKKSRIVNDYHHAKDAYLNIVVGNVYHVKFTSNPVNFLKEKKPYSMNRVFNFNVERNGKTAWVADNGTTLKHVLKIVHKNNILYTRHATEKAGGFFDQLPLKKDNGQFPLKTSDPRFDIAKYGGYNNVSGAYFFLVEHTVKNKQVKTIAHVPVYLTQRKENDIEAYIRDTLKFEDGKILLPKIKINTLFKIDGFYAHLSSRTDNRLALKNAQQLILSNEFYSYAKKIESYIERNKKLGTIENITTYHKITKEANLSMYDCFTDKLKNSIYKKRFSSQIPTFESGRELFENLCIENQCVVLYEVFNLFNTTASTADLRLIGGAKRSGSLKTSSNIEKISNFSIIHQSITGIFEKEINLKEL